MTAPDDGRCLSARAVALRAEPLRVSSVPASIANALDRPLDELELSVRTWNCLKNSNMRTVRDVVTAGEGDLLRIPNFGRKSLNELKELLSSQGLRLSWYKPPPLPEAQLENLPVIAFADLSMTEKFRYARTAKLPHAKGASQPYVYRGGGAPVPNGTPISIWSGSGWWVARNSSASDWARACVFRTRNGDQVRPELSEAPPEKGALARIASALERIAKAIEARSAETGTGSVRQDESAVPAGDLPETPSRHPEETPS